MRHARQALAEGDMERAVPGLEGDRTRTPGAERCPEGDPLEPEQGGQADLPTPPTPAPVPDLLRGCRPSRSARRAGTELPAGSR